MCEFISWRKMPHLWKPEVERRVFFLTNEDLASKRGHELRKYLGSQFDADKTGHGAISWFYCLDPQGINEECTDFSSPKNFPPEIVKAIKNCEFEGLGICLQILTEPSLAEFMKIERAARAEYEETKGASRAAIMKIEWVARAAFIKIEQAAWAKYEKTKQAAFWRLAKDPRNRRKEWR